jgi:hypothetical protein
MKKNHLIVICLLTAVMTILCMSVAAYAEGETGFTLTQSTNDALPGQTLEVTLNGSNLKNMYAYEAVFSYDDAVVEPDTAESKLDGFFIPPMTKDGKMIIAFTKIGKKDGENGSMPLCTISFKGKAQGNANIRLVSVKALDPDLTVTVYNGTGPIKTFTDLEGYEWARMQIEALAGQGIIKGTSETTFSPGLNITRADFICLLVRALGFEAEVDSNFDDVAQSDYFYRETGIAKKLGIVEGGGDGRLLPRENISRQDMMVCVSRAMKAAGRKLDESASDLSMFTDSDEVAGYASGAAAQLVKEGIIMGSGGRINPKGTATRAETAVIIYRILN